MQAQQLRLYLWGDEYATSIFFTAEQFCVHGNDVCDFRVNAGHRAFGDFA